MDGRRDLLCILSACSDKLLDSLALHFFPLNESIKELWQEALNIIGTKSIRSKRVVLEGCDWHITPAALLHIGAELSELQWSNDWTYAYTSHLLPGALLLDNFAVLELVDLSKSFVRSPNLSSLLKVVAPHLRSLILRGRAPIFSNAIWRLGHFPQLSRFICSDVPKGIYLAIVKEAPTLQEIDIPPMWLMPTSLLDPLPDTLKKLRAGLSRLQDPPHTLLTKIKRFKNLASLPVLHYGYILHEEEPEVGAVKEALIGHFALLGIKGSPQEEEEESVLTWEME